ncbi:hypothetical protein JCM8097_002751 [Rhodosporidiobolus ruineniae]
MSGDASPLSNRGTPAGTTNDNNPLTPPLAGNSSSSSFDRPPAPNFGLSARNTPPSPAVVQAPNTLAFVNRLPLLTERQALDIAKTIPEYIHGDEMKAKVLKSKFVWDPRRNNMVLSVQDESGDWVALTLAALGGLEWAPSVTNNTYGTLLLDSFLPNGQYATLFEREEISTAGAKPRYTIKVTEPSGEVRRFTSFCEAYDKGHTRALWRVNPIGVNPVLDQSFRASLEHKLSIDKSKNWPAVHPRGSWETLEVVRNVYIPRDRDFDPGVAPSHRNDILHQDQAAQVAGSKLNHMPECMWSDRARNEQVVFLFSSLHRLCTGDGIYQMTFFTIRAMRGGKSYIRYEADDILILGKADPHSAEKASPKKVERPTKSRFYAA